MMVVIVLVVHCVSPGMIVPNFEVEKYRPRLAWVETLGSVRGADELWDTALLIPETISSLNLIQVI